MQDSGTPSDVLTFGSREELEQRLSLVPPGDTARGFVFSTILHTVRNEAPEAGWLRCIEAAEAGSFIPFFNYSMRSLLRLFYTAGWELSDKCGGFDKAMWLLGARSAPDFLQSAVGKMLLALGGMNVKRLVGGIPVAYPTVYGHGSCTVDWADSRGSQLRLHGNLMPAPFIEGAVVHVLQAVRVPRLNVQVKRVAPTENVLRVTWH